MLTSVLCVCVVTNILHEGLHIVSFYLGCCTSNYNLPATLPPGEGIDFAPFGQKLPFSIVTTPYLYKRSEIGCYWNGNSLNL